MNALLWCARRRALVIADDTNGRLVSWNELRGFSPLGSIERPNGACRRLGQIASLPNGDLIVASYRGGVDHFRRGADRPRAWPGLDAEKNRLGIAVGAEGELYETYFVGECGSRCGAVARVGDLGGEQDLVAGLKKPVAIVEHDGALIVSDQAKDQVRGVAYDGADRIYIAERSPTDPRGHAFHILSLSS